MKHLRHIFILFSITSISLFFVINSTNDVIKYLKLNPNEINSFDIIKSIDWISFFAMLFVVFFGISAYDIKGKEMGFWGFISSILTAYIYYTFKNYTFVALYLYGSLMDLLLFIYGTNKIKKPNQMQTLIQIGIVFIFSIVLKIILDKQPIQDMFLKITWNTFLEYLTFVLYAVAQLLALKQTIWQFTIWIPKNVVEFILAIFTKNPVPIARNIYFLGMNLFAYIRWNNQIKEENIENKI